MADVKKVTKKEMFTEIKAVLEIVEGSEELVAFVEKQIEALDNEAAKAKERKAKKVAEDTLKDTVASLLTDEFQTAEAIVDAIGDEEVSKAKVVNRLSKLIADGVAVKEQTKVGDRKVVCYKLV